MKNSRHHPMSDSSKEDSYKRYCDVHDTFKKLPRHSLDHITLMSVLTRHKSIADCDTFRDSMGELYTPFCITQEKLNVLYSKLDYKIPLKNWSTSEYKIVNYTSSIDWENETLDLEEYIITYKRISLVIKELVDILEKAISNLSNKSVAVLTEDRLEKIKALASEFHNPSLAKKNTVTHIYNSGEITSQKGGDIYGSRTEFILFPAIPEYKNIQIEFPMKCFPDTYAIVTDSNAKKIRQLMIDVLQ